MELTGRVVRQIVLLTMLLVVVPMVVFPEQFGTNLARASLIGVMYEVVFYGFVCFLFHRRASLLRLVGAAGVCLVYRMAVGAVFGLTIAAMYSMNLRLSLTLGVFSYLPAIVLQIAAAPFILRSALLPVIAPIRQRHSLIRELELRESRSRARAESAPADADETPVAPVAAPVSFAPHRAPEAPVRHAETTGTTSESFSLESNGFDRATRYIAEDGSVHLAAIVDTDGLLLGQFSRGTVVAESWAPLALLLREANLPVLKRTDWGGPERISLLLPGLKVVAVFEADFNMLVIADRQQSDFLDIRINQGLDTVRKYMAHRYGRTPIENAERQYESSTQDIH